MAATARGPRPARPGNGPKLTTALALIFLAACGGTPKPVAHAQPQMSPEERARIHDKMMARENGPFPKHDITLLEGMASSHLESQTKPKVECKKDNDGDVTCVIEIDLGKDADGDPNSIVCNATTNFVPFGPAVKEIVGESQLAETPILEVKAASEGLTARFEAETMQEDATSVRLGTTKIAAFYSRGYRVLCWDKMAGGRKTFRRIVGEFFRDLKLEAGTKSLVTFVFGYQERQGERITGFRYGYFSKRPDEQAGFLELKTSFHLKADEKSWAIFDGGQEVVRDEAGAVESMRNLHWVDGKGPLVLSAKPSEEKRFRLKSEVGDKTNSLELTPKAPLNTEGWAAADLLKVSAGTSPAYRYAFLQLDSSDPALGYVNLTRLQPGVLAEEVETSAKKSATAANNAQPKDELHIDARGFITKEISSDSVTESIFTWGELPAASAPKKGAPAKTPAKKVR